jgi:hypothetical protein
MGWDVLVLKIPPAVKTVSQLADMSTEPLGPQGHVLSVIEAAFPDSDVSDPRWIVVTTDSYSIEISLIQAIEVEALMLHIHGTLVAIEAIERLCAVGGWRAFDSATGEFLDFGSPDRDAGFRRWRQYRNQIADQYGEK